MSALKGAALTALLVLTGCAGAESADCHFRNAECAPGYFCQGHTCRLADTRPHDYDVTFLLIPPDGSGWSGRAGLEGGPLVPTPVADPVGARRMTVCPASTATVPQPDGSGGELTAIGWPLEGLPLMTTLQVPLREDATSVRLPPGSWKLLLAFPGSKKSGPSTATLQVGNCRAPFALTEFDTVDLKPDLAVHLLVDEPRDPRPFCDARLDAVNVRGEVRSSVTVLEPGCTDPALVHIPSGGEQLFLRLRPRDPRNATIATQLHPIDRREREMTLSAVGPPGLSRRFTFKVVSPSGDPVLGASLFAEGIVLDGTRPWPADEHPALFEAQGSNPVAGERGVYTLDLIPGCYRVRAVPPPEALYSIGRNDPAGVPAGGICHPDSVLLRQPSPEGTVIRLPEKVLISGTIFRSDVRPVADAKVTAVPVEGPGREVSTFSQDDGTYVLRVDPTTETRYELLIQPPAGHGLPWTSLPVEDQSSISSTIPEPVWLAGSVVDPSGRPVPRTLVQAFPRPLPPARRPLGEAITDEDGNFTLLLPACLECL